MAGAQVVSENGNYVLGPVQLPELTSTAFKRTILGAFPTHSPSFVLVSVSNKCTYALCLEQEMHTTTP